MKLQCYNVFNECHIGKILIMADTLSRVFLFSSSENGFGEWERVIGIESLNILLSDQIFKQYMKLLLKKGSRGYLKCHLQCLP